MDKKIQPKDKRLKKGFLFGIPVLLILSVLIMNFTHKKQVNLKQETISIKEVKSGVFEDVVLFNSIVKPKTSLLVNVIQGGSVSEIYAESGQIVKKGAPLLKVYNPSAELGYLTQETAIVEQINNLRNIRVNIKNQQLNIDQQLLSIGNDYVNAERKYKADSTLYSKDVIAKNDFEKSRQNFIFQSERNDVIRKKASAEKETREIQLLRINTSINNMQKSLELLRKNKENFVVKAPVDGFLSSFNPVLGQTYTQGQNIGKIDMLNGFKLVAMIDEYYISKLKKNIKGSVVIEDRTYKINVSKIYPEVNKGQFKVELQFESDSIPEGIRRGMSLKSKVYLSNNSKALLIPKGQFYQSTRGKWAFVLISDQKAVKKNIRLGRENPFYYEVLAGLKEGDHVITSDYDDFVDVDEINIE